MCIYLKYINMSIFMYVIMWLNTHKCVLICVFKVGIYGFIGVLLLINGGEENASPWLSKLRGISKHQRVTHLTTNGKSLWYNRNNLGGIQFSYCQYFTSNMTIVRLITH